MVVDASATYHGLAIRCRREVVDAASLAVFGALAWNFRSGGWRLSSPVWGRMMEGQIGTVVFRRL
jgi:hypothetical protein